MVFFLRMQHPLKLQVKAQIVALDKTGTITVGKPKVTAIITEKETDEKGIAWNCNRS